MNVECCDERWYFISILFETVSFPPYRHSAAGRPSITGNYTYKISLDPISDHEMTEEDEGTTVAESKRDGGEDNNDDSDDELFPLPPPAGTLL